MHVRPNQPQHEQKQPSNAEKTACQAGLAKSRCTYSLTTPMITIVSWQDKILSSYASNSLPSRSQQVRAVQPHHATHVSWQIPPSNALQTACRFGCLKQASPGTRSRAPPRRSSQLLAGKHLPSNCRTDSLPSKYMYASPGTSCTAPPRQCSQLLADNILPSSARQTACQAGLPRYEE
jgi:hypothetical protein